MNDGPSIGETDQFNAAVRDLVGGLGLEVVMARGIDPDWLATHSADELYDSQVRAALKAGERGMLAAIVAVRRGRGDEVGHCAVVLRRAGPGGVRAGG